MEVRNSWHGVFIQGGVDASLYPVAVLIDELRNDEGVDVVGVSDENNIADIFTKCLRSSEFRWRVDQIRSYQGQ